MSKLNNEYYNVIQEKKEATQPGKDVSSISQIFSDCYSILCILLVLVGDRQGVSYKAQLLP